MSDELKEFVNEAIAPEETPAEDSATEETPQPEPQADAETGDKAEPEQQESEDVPPTPAEPEKQSDSVPKSALLDERKKRQGRERELKAAQAQLEQQQQQPAPDLLDDQQGYADHIQQQVDGKIRNVTIQMSQEMMRSQHEDYDQVEDKFLEMAQNDPRLGAEMTAHPMPAKFVYETVKKAEQYAEMQDVDTYKAKVEAEIRAKVTAEIEAEAKAKADKEAELNGALSPSLTNTRAAGANNEALSIPDPLANGGLFDR